MAANRAALEADGFDLSYPSRDGVPGGTLAMRLPMPRHGPEDIAAFKEKLGRILKGQVTEGRDKLLLSDENLPGVIRNFFHAKLYPNCGKRAGVLQHAVQGIGGEVAHMLFVIRPYAELFVSGYRKHAEDRPIGPFEEMADSLSRFQGGWPRTVQALRDKLRPDECTVVEIGRRGASRELLAELVGTKPDAFVEPDKALNVSATDAAMQALQEVYQSGGTLKRAEWKQVIERHASDTEDRGFARFDAAQKARLDARYADDLDKLRAMPEIRVIA